MGFPGIRRAQHLMRRALPKALILLYHRVSDSSSDPQSLCVSPQHFAEHLQILRQYYHPLSLMELQKRRALNRWLPRSVVITFDDGYQDNFQQACPMLEGQDMPATIFVATSGVDSQCEFWWDELERIFLLPQTLPPHLEIKVKKKEYVWELDDECPPAAWNVLTDATNARQRLYMDLMALVHDLSPATREALLSELFLWSGIVRTQARQENLAVRSHDLSILPKNSLIEIGAHTVNHPSLAALSQEIQRAEIFQGKKSLEGILDRPLSSFAYPYGERRDYTQQTVKIVQEAGFSCACSNFPAQVTAFSDPYQLPRHIVRDWDGETFAGKLEDWFHA